MPNWCSTAYAIEGNAKELKKLYDLMNGLQERKEPSVPNGFGTAWLGCLVDALGENWERYIVVEIGIICNLTVMYLPSTLRLHGLLVMRYLIGSVKNTQHYTISISLKSREWDCIVRMTRMASIFQTDFMLMYVFRRKNTIPNISQICRACMTGWRVSAICKFGQCRMLMRL